MNNYFDKMETYIRKKQFAELEHEFKSLCKENSTEEIAEQIARIDITNYIKSFEDGLKKAIETSRKTDLCKAIYFEYDLDNSWKGNFFLCDDYASEKEGNDDWASNWIEYIEGPCNKEFSDVFMKHGFNDLGVTLYLVARTLSGIGRVVGKIKSVKIPICVAYHDQSPILRLKKIAGSKKKAFNLESLFFIDISESNIYGYAKAPEGIHWNVFPPAGYVEDIEIQFKLKDGEYSDLMNNDIGLTICSEKLREVIDKNKSINDIIQWIDTYINSETGEIKKYFILRLPNLKECIDFNRSKFFQSPFSEYASYVCLDKSKIGDIQLLKIKYPDGKSGPSKLIISGNMRKHIEENKLTGIRFEMVDAM